MNPHSIKKGPGYEETIINLQNVTAEYALLH